MTAAHFGVRSGEERPVTETSVVREIRDLHAIGDTLEAALSRAVAIAQERAPKAQTVTIYLQLVSVDVQIAQGIRPMVSVRFTGSYYLQEPAL